MYSQRTLMQVVQRAFALLSLNIPHTRSRLCGTAGAINESHGAPRDVYDKSSLKASAKRWARAGWSLRTTVSPDLPRTAFTRIAHT